MKIVCDACQAKYSISDDKVQGKVFKIRCKKCSNIIVVRGGASAAEPAAAPAAEKETRTYDYGYDGGGDQAPAGDDSVWHVVINQDQVGPMTAGEVQQRFSAGEIDADTYIWREGFSDWLPIAQVDTFAGFVASGSSTAAAVGGGGGAAVAAMFSGGGVDEAGTVRSDPGDLFAASSAPRASDDDGDLFGSKPSKASSSQPSAAASKLRGERNENSVLFSLGNLAQLASDRPAPVTAAPSSSGHATGAAGGEGSGLIDIRSMASAYLGGGAGGAAKAATSSAIGSIDDLPVFGGGGFSEPAVIVPSPSRQQNSKLMYALIGSVALLAVAAVILVVVMLKKPDKEEKVASNTVTEDKDKDKDKPLAGSDAPTDKPVDTTADGSAGSATEPTDKPVDTTAKPEDKPADKPADKPKDKPAVKPKDKPRDTFATVPRDKPTKPAEKPVESKDQAGCDEVSCVLNNYEGACCAKYKKSKSGAGNTASKPTSGGGDVPESLDRTMISDGVGKVKARVMACGDKSSAKGQVKVSVKVNPDGSVANVSVKSTPDPGLGSCVESAMKKASFKKTQNGGSFGYPFVF
ncbi:MAG: zinc-ribbon domain-containing protein [Myxococcota bacterium]|nr:zinc-ribbon domain-containing protein [Myxococcota bacterium]